MMAKVRMLNTRVVKMMSHPKRKSKRANRTVCITTKVRRQINKDKRVIIKAMKRPIRTTHLLEKEEPRMLCLEKRQQYSPAVIFEQLRSNSIYDKG